METLLRKHDLVECPMKSKKSKGIHINRNHLDDDDLEWLQTNSQSDLVSKKMGYTGYNNNILNRGRQD